MEPILKPLRRQIFAMVRTHCDILIAAPPWASDSRIRHSNRQGPRPVRDTTWPRGRPDLKQAEQELVDMANIIGDFVLDMVKAAADSKVLVLLTFTENLGKARLGPPTSLWTDPAVLQYPERRRFTGTWLEKARRNLHGVLSNAGTVLKLEACVHGWPSFDDRGMYTGPLPGKSGSAEPHEGKWHWFQLSHGSSGERFTGCVHEVHGSSPTCLDSSPVGRWKRRSTGWEHSDGSKSCFSAGFSFFAVCGTCTSAGIGSLGPSPRAFAGCSHR